MPQFRVQLLQEIYRVVRMNGFNFSLKTFGQVVENGPLLDVIMINRSFHQTRTVGSNGLV